MAPPLWLWMLPTLAQYRGGLCHVKEHEMIKGLAITPPVLRRLAIGMIVEKNGKRLSEQDDQFTITIQVQSKE